MSLLDHGKEFAQSFGMILFDPLDQYSGKMEGDLEMRIPFQDLQKGLITVGEGVFEYVLEITDGLVVVDSKSEFDFFHGILPEFVLLL